MEALIEYCGQPCKINCDGNCGKAWGISGRPKVQLDPLDEDDFAWLADDELGAAPINPGTYEGGAAKPLHPEQFPNRWCVRECERCAKSRPGESDLPLPMRDFSQRFYNDPKRNGKSV